MNPVAETTPHEIYLRTSSQAKPNAPLKLYANVTGRFSVERQLDDRMSGKVRNSNIDAQNQRAGRTTIFVKTPTDLPPPNGKKKEGATMFRKPIRPADQPRPAPAPNAVASSNTASTPQQSQRSKEALRALRNRMIPCICTSQRTSEQIVKLVGGNNCSTAAKQDILKLLDEVRLDVVITLSPCTYLVSTNYRSLNPRLYPPTPRRRKLTASRLNPGSKSVRTKSLASQRLNVQTWQDPLNTPFVISRYPSLILLGVMSNIAILTVHPLPAPAANSFPMQLVHLNPGRLRNRSAVSHPGRRKTRRRKQRIVEKS